MWKWTAKKKWLTHLPEGFHKHDESRMGLKNELRRVSSLIGRESRMGFEAQSVVLVEWVSWNNNGFQRESCILGKGFRASKEEGGRVRVSKGGGFISGEGGGDSGLLRRQWNNSFHSFHFFRAHVVLIQRLDLEYF